MKKFLILLLSLISLHGGDLTFTTQEAREILNEISLELLSEKPRTEAVQTKLEQLRTLELSVFEGVQIRPDNTLETAWLVGKIRSEINHRLASEMIRGIEQGKIRLAQEARALIEMPRHANAVEGSLALSQLEGSVLTRKPLLQLVSKEYGLWQTSRIHEGLETLEKGSSLFPAPWIALKAGELEGLASFPTSISQYFPTTSPLPAEGSARNEREAILSLTSSFQTRFSVWKTTLTQRLPLLIDPAEVTRREKMILKLIRLVPQEYRAGVRDGEIVIPIEYREAKSFTTQAQGLSSELNPFWQKDPLKSAAIADLEKTLNALAQSIHQRVSIEIVQSQANQAIQIMSSQMGIIAKKAGKSNDVIEESYLEIRQSLRQSLEAANQGNWREAEAARQEAYTTFDLEIEMRLLPRDPDLALRSEKRFLDGISGEPGIKAALDSRADSEKLQAAYDRVFIELEKTKAVLQVGISPSMVIISAISIFAREGLEAVTILAALLAGFRGTEPAQVQIRRRIVSGVWLALVASLLTFGIMQFVVQSLSRHGEVLEAVISVLAVLTLLFVTNWVFHKYYWAQWNSTLRDLGKKASQAQDTRWENWAMVGVGFLTIYREGFEVSLFLQTLILEGGWGPVLIGIGCGASIVAGVGFLIFKLGSKLPYRKLLVMTGGLVVLLLMTFAGSTVRLFQTVGWLPVHPIENWSFPSWLGLWFGIYPSWEGLLAPITVIVYIGGAWLFVKITAIRDRAKKNNIPFPAGSSSPHL